jgi:uncharacterized protein involved in type VI secretion and phage assembly
MPEETTAGSEGTEGAGESGGSAAAVQQQPAAKSYSPEEMERIIAQRVNKAKQGFADYDDLKAKAARADELEQAQQTETDKLRSKAERESQKRAEAEEKASKAQQRAQTALMRAAVVAAASQLNAADPGDVFTLLDKSSLSIDDDDSVSGAREAVDALLKAKPHLLRRTAGGFDGGRQGGPVSPGQSMTDRIREAAGISPRY